MAQLTGRTVRTCALGVSCLLCWHTVAGVSWHTFMAQSAFSSLYSLSVVPEHSEPDGGSPSTWYRLAVLCWCRRCQVGLTWFPSLSPQPRQAMMQAFYSEQLICSLPVDPSWVRAVKTLVSAEIYYMDHPYLESSDLGLINAKFSSSLFCA